jgi:hypothetical protein
VGQRESTTSLHKNFYFADLSKFLFICLFLMGQSKWLIANQKKEKEKLGNRSHLINGINKV